MRSSLLMRSVVVVVVCLCLGGTALAQVNSKVICLDRELAGQPPKVLWTNSFSAFLDAHRGELSADQTKLLQQAIDLGSSRGFALNNALSLHAVKGLLASARQMLTRDQLGEILAGMGSDTQHLLLEAAAVDVVACSCTTGPNDGCPSGFPCTVGCFTWGTGRWNGICKMQVQQQQPAQSEQP